MSFEPTMSTCFAPRVSPTLSGGFKHNRHHRAKPLLGASALRNFYRRACRPRWLAARPHGPRPHAAHSSCTKSTGTPLPLGDGFLMGPPSLSPQVTARTSVSHMLWLRRQGRPRVRGDQFARHLPSTPTALSASGQFVVRSRMPSMRAQHLRFAVSCSSRRHRA